jgi:hypothetical protein
MAEGPANRPAPSLSLPISGAALARCAATRYLRVGALESSQTSSM